MVNALVVSDEEDPGLSRGARPDGIDLVVSAGDLPFDYLADIADRLGCPGVLVPGNHDRRGELFTEFGSDGYFSAVTTSSSPPA